MSFTVKIKKNRTRQHYNKDRDYPEQIINSDPHFTKDPSFYEEMEWYLSGNFISVGKIISKSKAIRRKAQPC
jgi:hypothetical protein